MTADDNLPIQPRAPLCLPALPWSSLCHPSPPRTSFCLYVPLKTSLHFYALRRMLFPLRAPWRTCSSLMLRVAHRYPSGLTENFAPPSSSMVNVASPSSSTLSFVPPSGCVVAIAPCPSQAEDIAPSLCGTEEPASHLYPREHVMLVFLDPQGITLHCAWKSLGTSGLGVQDPLLNLLCTSGATQGGVLSCKYWKTTIFLYCWFLLLC